MYYLFFLVSYIGTTFNDKINIFGKIRKNKLFPLQRNTSCDRKFPRSFLNPAP